MTKFIAAGMALSALCWSPAAAPGQPEACAENHPGVASAAASDTLPVIREEPPQESVDVDKEPELVTKKSPAYPRAALEEGIEGKVFLSLWVGVDGKVRDTKVVKSDNPVFNQAAIDAAKEWVFAPAQKAGRPVSVWVTVPFQFRLGKEAAILAENARVLPRTLRQPTVLLITGPKGLRDMITYPAAAIEKRIQGAVFAGVTLSDQMTVSSIKITKGLEKSCDAAVMRGIASFDFSQVKETDGVKPGSTVSVVVQFLLPAK